MIWKSGAQIFPKEETFLQGRSILKKNNINITLQKKIMIHRQKIESFLKILQKHFWKT